MARPAPFFWARPHGIEPPPAPGSHLLPYLGLGHWKKAAVGGVAGTHLLPLWCLGQSEHLCMSDMVVESLL